MERLTKSERIGLIVFACAVGVFLLTIFTLDNITVVKPADENMLEQMKQFEKKVESAKSDTIVKPKAQKKKKATKENRAEDINPLNDKLERGN